MMSNKLHMYRNEHDWVVARNLDEAIEIWENQTGENWEDYKDSDEWYKYSDDEPFKVHYVDDKWDPDDKEKFNGARIEIFEGGDFVAHAPVSWFLKNATRAYYVGSNEV
jgi:hypothetical protein